MGTDDTSLQPVHARKRYEDHEIVWGARHADILTEDAEGNIVLDVRRFHDIRPTDAVRGLSLLRDAAVSRRARDRQRARRTRE